MKCIHTNACPFRVTNPPCASGCPSENCHNRGNTRAPTSPSLTTTVSQTIEETQESAPTVCQAIVPVVFHPDAPAFSTSILTRGSKWPDLPTRADNAHAVPELTETASPDPATSAAVRSVKINSNHARPTYGQIASPSPSVNQDSDVMSVASIGESDGDSDYVESAKNSPTIPANMPDLAGHISKLEATHEVSEGDLDAIARPTVLFSHTDKLKIPELDNSETDPPENHQDNGATLPVNTQPSPPHSPLEDTLVAFVEPPPRPHVEARDAALQAREGELLDFRLLGANYMLYGVYQYWVHQNPGNYLDRRSAEDIKWQAQWKNLFVCLPKSTTHLLGKSVRYFW